MGGQAFDGVDRLSGAFKFDPNELVIVGLDKPYDGAGAEHPLWDPRAKLAANQELVESILTQGILQPIRVTKDDDGNALVVMGRGRVLAARAANARLKGTDRPKVQVPAVIMSKGSSDFELGLAKIAENQLRTADTALAIADKAAAALRVGGDSPEARKALAVALGIPTRRLEDLLQLRAADPVLVKAAKAGEVGTEQALALAKMPRLEQAVALAKVITEDLSVVQTREHVHQTRALKAHNNGETGKAAARFPPPSKATVRRVLADKEGKAILRDEPGDRVARWIMGDLAPTQIKGLLAVMTGGG